MYKAGCLYHFSFTVLLYIYRYMYSVLQSTVLLTIEVPFGNLSVSSFCFMYKDTTTLETD